MIAFVKLNGSYWTDFKIIPSDIEFIYNFLLDKATPLTTDELLIALVKQRIDQQLDSIQKQTSALGRIYLPKELYSTGDKLLFPSFDMQSGQVTAVRNGFNPEYSDLKVIEVKMDSEKTVYFASNIADHPLNHYLDTAKDDPNIVPENVLQQYGSFIRDRLSAALKSNPDLVKIAGCWFPRSLLVDISMGHLNLAEAVLEEAHGGPLSVADLIRQVELSTDVDEKLLEFSFDLALQEDKRFDEVGPAGETLWFLHEMEPEDVKQIPDYLKYTPQDYPREGLQEYLELFEGNLYDELECWDSSRDEHQEISISLIYPHWRAGTLPLSNSLRKLFPTAHEAPRVNFSFLDELTQKSFGGWVVRNNNYISGLSEWYAEHELIPGSLVKVRKSEKPGQILLRYNKSRQNKEWLKTVLIGSDRGIVFAMLKQNISADFNERMAIAIPDPSAVDEIWQNRIYEKESLIKTVVRITRELSKLNPQGQVHAQELYAAVNVVRRCPPSLILYHLLNQPSITHLGDLYFRLAEKES